MAYEVGLTYWKEVLRGKIRCQVFSVITNLTNSSPGGTSDFQNIWNAGVPSTLQDTGAVAGIRIRSNILGRSAKRENQMSSF